MLVLRRTLLTSVLLISRSYTNAANDGGVVSLSDDGTCLLLVWLDCSRKNLDVFLLLRSVHLTDIVGVANYLMLKFREVNKPIPAD